MRLDKYLTECGLGSRSEVKRILKMREIRVNGKIEFSPKFNVSIDDEIVFNGETIEYKEMRYYIMNKPAGYITATEDKKHKTVMEILPEWVIQKNLFPVGRLDKDTEGLLLFTNDGPMSHELLSPKKHVDKIYYVEAEKNITDEDIKKLELGVDIGGYITKPSKCERVDENKMNLTISEGRFHQVKKMLHAVDNSVIYLKRIKFANLELGDLEIGDVREINAEEIL
ncbi:pseudouridine synthase [Psychrilyobacter atlanticus]|uniref:pseudouridine synthase n=1 Tax=Psychrilyobacter atlanticus TaxID=271091 RepID=UPI000429ED5C|nr:pseudouridine synthase [Psychrilyobacter atlanticus]